MAMAGDSQQCSHSAQDTKCKSINNQKPINVFTFNESRSGLVRCGPFAPRFRDCTRCPLDFLRSRSRTTNGAHYFFYQFNWSVLFIVSVRSSAVQRLINQCVLNYPKILRFPFFIDLKWDVRIASPSFLSRSRFAMQRHSIYLFVAGETIMIIRAFTAKNEHLSFAQKAMGFSILLFLLCESKLPPRSNRFSSLFFFIGKS